MKRSQRAALAAVLLCSAGATEAATFTYHGTLQDSGKPAEGNYDIELTLYSAPTAGSVVGGPLMLHGVAVHQGNFNVEADFGPLAHSYTQAYVETKVGAAGTGDLLPLSGRAIVASTASTVCPGAWTLEGNAGNPSGSYIGTADSQPLIFQVNATQVGNIASSSPDQPTVVFGASSNAAIGVSATVSGGEKNSLAGAYATIAGGQSNTIGLAEWAVIGGGQKNNANATNATVGGGNVNTASGVSSTAGGGFSNTAGGQNSAIAGGQKNNASGNNSTIAGGVQNSAGGGSSTVPGGALNSAGGDLSFAAGGDAYVRDATQAGNSSSCTSGSTCGDFGTFVWNGGYPVPFTSSGPQQFLVNAPGGVGIDGQPASDYVYGGTAVVTINGNAASSDRAELALVPTGSAAGNSIGGFPVSQFNILAYSSSAQPNVGYLEITGNSAGSGTALFLDNSGNLTITGNASKPGGGSWSTSSDRRIKQDVAPIRDAIDTLMKLRPVNFHYTPDYRTAHANLPDKAYAGFIAQEFADVFPEAVTSTGERVPGAADGEAPILALDQNPALITTVAAVQELAVRAQADDDDIAKLKRDNAELRRLLADVVKRLPARDATGTP